MKLMLVEDEYLLNKAIKNYLLSKKFQVESFMDGLKAFEAIHNGYDLFILDIDIPDMSGLELLEEIRKFFPTTPIIMISATLDMNVITESYTKGCNDYLKKHFDIKELELKVRALTRDKEIEIHITQSLLYSKESAVLSFEGREIALTSYEKSCLTCLLQNRGRVVSHELLEQAVWKDADEQTHLRQLVSRLRKKIPEEIIQNRVNEGYIIV